MPRHTVCSTLDRFSKKTNQLLIVDTQLDTAPIVSLLRKVLLTLLPVGLLIFDGTLHYYKPDLLEFYESA